MQDSWKKFGILCLAVVMLLLGGFGIYRSTKPKAVGAPCGVADTYGFHNWTDADPTVTCPDPRQKLNIERTGNTLGTFDYRCHCD